MHTSTLVLLIAIYSLIVWKLDVFTDDSDDGEV